MPRLASAPPRMFVSCSDDNDAAPGLARARRHGAARTRSAHVLLTWRHLLQELTRCAQRSQLQSQCPALRAIAPWQRDAIGQLPTCRRRGGEGQGRTGIA